MTVEEALINSSLILIKYKFCSVKKCSVTSKQSQIKKLADL